ncbi:hypothetical protein [Streptomyces sp. NBC_01465]|uniref:hypothetical protein n=1 Tax=Streptomyces sp. NBC_01465 TaxID=2903878 RepID=UPI002E3785FB|nr:hypothetical protein [Streptomyces sp. NBC_01465]
MRREEKVPETALVTPEIETLAERVRDGGTIRPDSAEQALAAFRAARDAGEHAAPGRHRARDDWRPVRRRLPARTSLRAALGAAVATVTLGGVALAAGTGAIPDPFGRADDPGRKASSPQAPDASRTSSGAARSQSPGGPTGSARTPSGQSLEALCRAQDNGNGKRKGKAFQRLAAAAGGANAVNAYCAGLLGTDATATPKPGKPSAAAKSTKAQRPSASPSRGKSSGRPDNSSN